MYKNKSFTVIIPARGCSISLPHKNLCLINGLPMVAYPIIAAKSSSLVDRVIVSTEDAEIKSTALDFGAEVPFIRPKKLVEAHATSIDVLSHAENEMKKQGVTWDYSIFMQCTTPLVSTEDIENAIKIHTEYKPDTTISVSKSPINPQWLLIGTRFGSNNLSLEPLEKKCLNLDRQFLQDYFRPNGAIYINHFGAGHIFGKKLMGYIMPPERSIDVDDKLDLIIANAVAKYLVNEKEELYLV